MKKENFSSKMSLASAMVVFGTIGLFVRNIDMPSSIIAFIRGSVGALFLILFCLMTKKKFSFSAVKEKLLKMVIVLSTQSMGKMNADLWHRTVFMYLHTGTKIILK